jgi:hypothetical protein
LARKLVKIVGRKDVIGRPLLYGTTRQFLEVFGLRDLAALPGLNEVAGAMPESVGAGAAGGEEPGAVMTDQTKGIRLQKLLAESGSAPGGAAEAMIRSGRVTVNGKTVRPWGHGHVPLTRSASTIARCRRDAIRCTFWSTSGRHRDDDEGSGGRPTILQMLPSGLSRLFPVGRLDVQSTGLVLLTNDGALAAVLTHPRYHVPRTYR